MLSFLLSSASLAAPRIDPRFAQNITVYHVNPAKDGAIPLNMDTGNAPGDLFFDLLEVIIRLPAQLPERKGVGPPVWQPGGQRRPQRQ